LYVLGDPSVRGVHRPFTLVTIVGGEAASL